MKLTFQGDRLSEQMRNRCGTDACKNLNYTCTGNESNKPCVCGNKFLGPNDLKSSNSPWSRYRYPLFKALNNTYPDVYLKNWTTWTYPPKNPRDKYPNNNGLEGPARKRLPQDWRHRGSLRQLEQEVFRSSFDSFCETVYSVE